MLSSYHKSEYKNFAFTSPVNFSKSSFNGKTFVKVSPHSFNHHSVIAENTFKQIKELYPEYDVSMVLKPDELHHERNKKDIQKILTRSFSPKQLEYYISDLDLIIEKFLNYMERISSSKFLLVGTSEISDIPIIWEGLNRFQSNRNINKYSKELSYIENSNIPAVLTTLTYDHDKRSVLEAWHNVAKDFRLFRQKLFYELGYSIPYLWVIEAQKNGYPHIHALFFGVDFLYNNGTFEDYVKRQNGLPTDKSIQSMWGYGFTWVNRTKEGVKIKSPISYLMKYVRKTWAEWSPDTVLTKSLLWLFNKRSFNVSRDFKSFCELYNPDISDIPKDTPGEAGGLGVSVSLDYSVIIEKAVYHEVKPVSPVVPVVLPKSLNHVVDNTNCGVMYECHICYSQFDFRGVKSHFKTHGLVPDRLLYSLVKNT